MAVVLNENMQKVVAALRSGDFQQTRAKLNRVTQPQYILDAIEDGTIDDYKDDASLTVGHCCLGVASEVAVREGIISKTTTNYGDGSDELIGVFGENGDENFLPSEVAVWLGLPGYQKDLYFDLTDKADDFKEIMPDYVKDGVERYGKFIVRASDLNDRYNYTFDMLADLIESGKMVDINSVSELFM